MNKNVDFFIIGAQKAGTTSLYKYLNEHPDIFMPKVKENHFFAEERFYKRGVEYFHKYYEDYSNQQLAGGAYVHLFSCNEAPERIFNYNRNAKILIMLRNPIDRAYSAYNFALKNGWESPKNAFLETIKLQSKRSKGNFTEQTDLSYFQVGLYNTHISNWLKWFKKDQLFILLDTDLKQKDQQPIKNLFGFLGVDKNVNINTEMVYNKSGDVKFKSVHYFIRDKESPVKRIFSKLLPFKARYFLRTRLRKFIDKFNMIEKKYEKLTIEERAEVYKYFENDVQNLSVLLDKDFDMLWRPK